MKGTSRCSASISPAGRSAIVKHYPLEAECNPSAPSNHYASCEAAAAVIMARASGTAQKLEQWIFTNQPSLTPDKVKKAARDIGGIQDFDARYPSALKEVKADATLGAKVGIRPTSTSTAASWRDSPSRHRNTSIT